MRKKILFLITTKYHGIGGHHFSLNSIALEIAKTHDVGIITIGTKSSYVLKNNKYFLGHIYFTGFNIISLYNSFIAYSAKLNPDIYHFFDDLSYSLIKLFINSKKKIIVLNKCGGPNNKRFPSAKNVVLFSKENLEWFNSKIKFKDTNLFFIPNRVHRLQTYKSKPIHKDNTKFNFLRISRISRRYEKSFNDSLNLLERLISSGFNNVRLIIIGVVEDEIILAKLKEHYLYRKKYVEIYTENNFVKEASKMLYLADAVIGVGRGFMEASSLGLPLLAINAKGSLPVLINEDNFQDVLKTNISLRNEFNNYDIKNNLKMIQEMIDRTHYYEYLSKLSKDIFVKYFSVENIHNKYNKVYAISEHENKTYFEDLMYMLKSWLKYIRLYYFLLVKSKHN